jgi:hypothetical protein
MFSGISGPKNTECLDQLSNYQFLKNDSDDEVLQNIGCLRITIGKTRANPVLK